MKIGTSCLELKVPRHQERHLQKAEEEEKQWNFGTLWKLWILRQRVCVRIPCGRDRLTFNTVCHVLLCFIRDAIRKFGKVVLPLEL